MSTLQIWDEQKQLIEESLTKWDTDRTLHFALCQDLQNWRLNLPFSPIQLLPEQIQHIIVDLRTLTYPRVLEGLLPKSMISYQHHYFVST